MIPDTDTCRSSSESILIISPNIVLLPCHTCHYIQLLSTDYVLDYAEEILTNLTNGILNKESRKSHKMQELKVDMLKKETTSESSTLRPSSVDNKAAKSWKHARSLNIIVKVARCFSLVLIFVNFFRDKTVPSKIKLPLRHKPATHLNRLVMSLEKERSY